MEFDYFGANSRLAVPHSNFEQVPRIRRNVVEKSDRATDRGVEQCQRVEPISRFEYELHISLFHWDVIRSDEVEAHLPKFLCDKALEPRWRKTAHGGDVLQALHNLLIYLAVSA